MLEFLHVFGPRTLSFLPSLTLSTSIPSLLPTRTPFPLSPLSSLTTMSLVPDPVKKKQGGSSSPVQAFSFLLSHRIDPRRRDGARGKEEKKSRRWLWRKRIWFGIGTTAKLLSSSSFLLRPSIVMAARRGSKEINREETEEEEGGLRRGKAGLSEEGSLPPSRFYSRDGSWQARAQKLS